MRVGIVNDLTLAVEALRRAILESGHIVAWVAPSGTEAVRLSKEDPADVILMDLIMPGMDGIEATRRIMRERPCPILIVTATVAGYSQKVQQALQCGAIAAVPTPILKDGGRPMAAEQLLARLDEIDASHKGRPDSAGNAADGTASNAPRYLVAIGASAGGPPALARILPELPPHPAAAIVIVQHVDSQFAPVMASWLNEQSKVPVRLARPGESVSSGVALLAGGEGHLVFRTPTTLAYTQEPRGLLHHPSIDVFFESMLTHWKGHVIAALLTGMGRDGAMGLKAVRRAGHLTIAQDEATSSIYGMPKAAAELDAAASILPLEEIGPAIRSVLANPMKNSIQVRR